MERNCGKERWYLHEVSPSSSPLFQKKGEIISRPNLRKAFGVNIPLESGNGSNGNDRTLSKGLSTIHCLLYILQYNVNIVWSYNISNHTSMWWVDWE